MKRIAKGLTALAMMLVMVLTLLPAEVLAVEQNSVSVYTEAYINPVYADILGERSGVRTQTMGAAASVQSAEETPVYNSVAAAVAGLREQMIARKESISLTIKLPHGSADVDSQELWTSALDHAENSGTTGDYLRWQYAGYASSTTTSSSPTAGNAYTITYTAYAGLDSIWYTTAAQEQQLTSRIRSTILPALALDGKTTYQKVQAIYDWITRNVRYDHAHRGNSDYKLQFTAYAAALNGTSVCQGYANLFYRLANDAGIDCRIITGRSNGGAGWENHAWNIVRMDDGKYYFIDATWDEGRTQSSWQYFLKGLTKFNSDHTVAADAGNTYFWADYAPRVSSANYTVQSSDTSSGTSGGGTTPGGTTTGGSTEGGGSESGNTVPAPAAVTVNSAKADKKGNITVKWKKAANAKTYVVLRRAAGESDWTVIERGLTKTSYVDGTPTAGVTYTYTVQGVAADGVTTGAINAAGKSAMIKLPGVIKVNSVKADKKGGITIKWKKDANAKTYVVLRKAADESDWRVIESGLTKTSYVDKTAQAGVTYTYTVRGVAFDGVTMGSYDTVGKSIAASGGSGGASGGGSATAPAAVKVNSAKADKKGNITVKWKKAANAKTYIVLRRAAGESDWTVIERGLTKTSYVDKAAMAGVTYTYTVQGVAADGVTTGSYDTVGKSAMIKLPGAVKVNSVKAGKTGITVKWKKDVNTKSYSILRKAADGSDWTVIESGLTKTSYVDKTAQPGVTYTYTVRGVAFDGVTMGGYDTVGKTVTMPGAAGGNT